MKNKISTILLAVFFLAGLSLLLYPTVSDYLNSLHSSRAVAAYDENIRGLNEETYQQILTDTREYNRLLFEKNVGFALSPELKSRYSELLDIGENGIMGYVEIPNMENNVEAAEAIVEYIYENIMYAELNSKSDYCQCCGYSGEIQIVEDDGKLVWECPNCGNRDQHKMNVARRTCGYIGTQYWNQGRTAEIRDRVTHIDCEMGTE